MSEGVIIPVGGHIHIAVDYWRKSKLQVSAYFLTHMHADHTEGLNDAWHGGRIYCSAATAELLQEKWQKLSAEVVVLETGETHPVVLQPPARGGTPVQMAVTPLDACHCIGAVMFMFEGAFGRILHTGDFRWELAAQVSQEWHPVLTHAPIDLLFLDNTYCHPRFAAPTRAAAAAQVVALIQAHPRHDIVIGVDSLGKEELLAEAAAALQPGELLGLNPNRALPLWLGGWSKDLFTAAEARVRVAPRWQLTHITLARLNRSTPTLGIVASGFGAAEAAAEAVSQQRVEVAQHPCAAATATFDQRHDGTSETRGGGGSGSSAGGRKRMSAAQYKTLLASVRLPAPQANAPPTAEELAAARKLMRHVPYSLHADFAELKAFVGRLRPKAVQGIVKKRPGPCLDPATHFADLLSSRGTNSASHDAAAARTGSRAVGGSSRSSSPACDQQPSTGTVRVGSWRGLFGKHQAARQQLRQQAGLALNPAGSDKPCQNPGRAAMRVAPCRSADCDDGAEEAAEADGQEADGPSWAAAEVDLKRCSSAEAAVMTVSLRAQGQPGGRNAAEVEQPDKPKAAEGDRAAHCGNSVSVAAAAATECGGASNSHATVSHQPNATAAAGRQSRLPQTSAQSQQQPPQPPHAVGIQAAGNKRSALTDGDPATPPPDIVHRELAQLQASSVTPRAAAAASSAETMATEYSQVAGCGDPFSAGRPPEKRRLPRSFLPAAKRAVSKLLTQPTPAA